MKAFWRVALFGLVITLGGLFAKPSFALEEQVFEQKNTQKVTLEPALQEVILNDEVEIPITIVLENTATIPQRYTLKAVDFGTLDESGGVAFLGTGDPRDYDVASWLSIPVTDILVAPESKTTVNLAVTNSGKLAPGGHYGALLFENTTNDQDAPDATKIAVKQVFSALIYMRKVGGEIFSLELNDLNYTTNHLRLPSSVALRFTNSGNTHVVPRGSVRISDPFGRTIQKAIINEESSLVLPTSSRRFEENFVSIEKAWIPGHYTVLTEYRYDGKDSYEKRVQKYWYFPPLSILVLVLIIGGVVFWKWKKFSWKKIRRGFFKRKK